MENNPNYIYSREVVEFVTVAAEYCLYLEQAQNKSTAQLTDTMLKLLPLLYLKSTLLPTLESDEMVFVEDLVSQDDYDVIQQTLQAVMGGADDYLDVFVEEMKYSDVPVRKTISEDLADIYQDTRNFLGLYKQQNEEVMWTALATVKENFELYWGQTLVNTLRALHEVKYNQLAHKALDEALY